MRGGESKKLSWKFLGVPETRPVAFNNLVEAYPQHVELNENNQGVATKVTGRIHKVRPSSIDREEKRRESEDGVVVAMRKVSDRPGSWVLGIKLTKAICKLAAVDQMESGCVGSGLSSVRTHTHSRTT